MSEKIKDKILITDVEEAKKYITNETIINKLMNINKKDIILKNSQKNYYGNSPIPTIYDKEYYKLNNEFSLYPSPEKKLKNQLNPIVFKSGILKSNPEKLCSKPQYYVPVMEKNKDQPLNNTINNPFYFMNTRYRNNSLNLYRKIKNHISIDKKAQDLQRTENNKNEIKNIRGKMSIYNCPFNITGKSIYNGINPNENNNKNFNTSEYLKYNIWKRRNHYPDFFQEQINRKRNEYKDQILLRNKYQHNKNYDIEKYYSNIILESKFIKRDTKNAITECKNEDFIENNNIPRPKNAGEIIADKCPNSKVSGYDKLYLNSS